MMIMMTMTMKMMIFLVFLSCSGAEAEAVTAPRIAIVGAGIGGAATAYFVRQELPTARVTVFEAAPRVGGRIESFRWHGRVYELGAEVFTTFNYVMHQLLCGGTAPSPLNVTILGCSAADPAATDHDHEDEESDDGIWVWDGASLEPWRLLTPSLNTARTLALAHAFKRDLVRNYRARVDAGSLFRSVSEFLRADGFPYLQRYVSASIASILRDGGVNDEDWIQASISPART